MNRFLYQMVCLTLLGALAGWVGYLETVRYTQLAEIIDARRIIQHEMETVFAAQQAQAQSEPLMSMVEKLAAQNTAYIKVVDEARRIVAHLKEESVCNREAVDHSVELLQQASVEHNRNIDHIRKLEQFIDKLLEKIPRNERPDVPKPDKPKKWS